MGNNISRESQEKLMLQRKRQADLLKKEKKKERRKTFVKVLILILVFVFVFVFYEQGFSIKFDNIKFDKINFNFNWFKKNKKSDNSNSNLDSNLVGKTIAYVPIDDRSMHINRIEFLAQSGGYTIELPDSKFYKTNIDKGENSYASYSTKYGNPSKISSWLLEKEDEGCDYYIISLDQMFSGGLVGSAYLRDEDFDVYDKGIDASKRVLEKLMSDKKNHIYLIDSVMGLSVTPGFMDFTEEDYKALVAYTSQKRSPLAGADLTIDKISDGYKLNVNGESITTTLDEVKLNKYLAARSRKLKYSNYILKAISKSENVDNIHLYYGVEDSGNSQNNIQNNDLLYLDTLSKKYEVEFPVREGSSTLSEVAFADMVLDSVSQSFNVKVTYYGDPNKMVINGQNYSAYMDNLFKDLNLNKTDSNPDFEVLVYNSVDDGSKREEITNQLLAHYLKNIHDKVPTVIVNNASSGDMFLIDNLSNYDKTSIPMGYLIGYSNWGSFVHSSRIGISEGVVRYLYLASSAKKTDKADKGFLRVMGVSFYEDMAYIPTNKQTTNLNEIDTNMSARVTMISHNLSNSNYISSLSPYKEKGIRTVSMYGMVLPWSRPSEISFDISASVEDKKDIVIPDTVTYKKEG